MRFKSIFIKHLFDSSGIIAGTLQILDAGVSVFVYPQQ